MVGTWFYQRNVQVNIYNNLALAHLPMGIIGEEVKEGSLFALLILLPLSLSLRSYNDLGYDPHFTLSRLIHANCPSHCHCLSPFLQQKRLAYYILSRGGTIEDDSRIMHQIQLRLITSTQCAVEAGRYEALGPSFLGILQRSNGKAAMLLLAGSI